MHANEEKLTTDSRIPRIGESNAYFPWVTLHASAKQSDDGSRTLVANLVGSSTFSVVHCGGDV